MGRKIPPQVDLFVCGAVAAGRCPRVNLRSGKVSIIIPARNEEVNLEGVLCSLASQEGWAEIVVVNDQSDDRSTEILKRLRGEIADLIVLNAPELPAGWVGKNHALHWGAARAKGDVLLFTYADTRHAPGSLARCLGEMEKSSVDLYSLSPAQLTLTFWERATIPFLYVQLSKQFRFADVENPKSDQAAANGQYLLIRRAAYESLGGHEAVRGEILEDVALARRAKQARFRLHFAPGKDRVATRMYRCFGELREGWTKNLYSLWGARPVAAAKACVRALVFDLGPTMAFLALWVLFLLDPGNAPALALSLGFFLPACVCRWRYEASLRELGFPSSLAPYQQLGAVLFVLFLGSSALTYLRGTQIHWKGRSYPASRF